MVKPLVGKRKRGHVIRREKAREPEVVEKNKSVLLLRATRAGPHGLELLRDLRRIKGADNSVLFSRKNDELRPFEDETRLEFFCNKNDCGMFAMVSHSKKRPNNLVLGRIYDQQLLDMIELSIDGFVSVQEMLKRNTTTASLGGARAILFQGSGFDKSPEMEALQSMLMDLFRAPRHDQVDLSALDHLVVCTAVEGKVYVRNYVVAYKGKDQPAAKKQKVGENRVASVQVGSQKVPDIALLEMGPSIDLSLRRNKMPSPALLKLALRQPKTAKTAKKQKNVKHDEFEGKVGRIHMKRQDMSNLVTRSRFKRALKRTQGSAAKK